MRQIAIFAFLFLRAVNSQVAHATEVDLSVVNKIRDEGFHRSEVMNTVSHLVDHIGGRLTGSPQMLSANNWTKEKLTEWGLENARLEGFDFGPGWTYDHIVLKMTSPRETQLYGLPIAWYPGTGGVLEGEVYYAPMSKRSHFKKYKGKLKGKIVFVDRASSLKEPSNEVFVRRGEDDLKKSSENYRIPDGEAQKDVNWWVNYLTFPHLLEEFLEKEGALAIVKRSPRDAMQIEAAGYQHWGDHLPSLPGVTIAAEHYNRTVRLLKAQKDVKLSINVSARYHKKNMKSYSTLADIPGTDKAREVVMAGAHLDSWFEGDGAVDNAAGVAVVMEAARILKAIKVRPRRTIRIALWGGEEQGYFGSQQYVMDYLATRPENKDKKLRFVGPYERYYGQFPITKKFGFEDFSVYFNVDNGSGRFRGIYAESNVAAASIFKKWFEPFHDVKAKTVSLNTTGGTDHEVFDDIGLPGFQFIQDPLDYSSRLHHTQIDMLDHVYEEDIKQAAVIMASFLYNAAMMPEKMPRKPEPQPED